MSQLGLTKENNEIIKIYEINIDWVHTIIILVTALIIVLSLLLLVAYAILLERKVLGSIQKRRGPNLVGIFGLLQPIADAVKLIVKETIIPVSSNRIIFIIAPLLTLILSLLNWSIIPFSTFAVLADIRVSILMFFAISSLSVYGIIMSGWSSNSKYAFLGALRAAAQVIAYEVSIGLTLIYVLLQSSDLNYSKIIFGQIGIWNAIPCFIFFILFFISTLAETNRPPFDLPEAEAELVSGYNVEYSAMAFGFFFLGEYVAIWTVCCLNIILFWGGYLTIFNYQSIYIYSLKVIALVITFIWIRGSLPRYRYDQLMRLGWKILLPISLGFVILYSGFFYFRLFSFYYHILIEKLGLDEYELMHNAEKLYNCYNFFIDLNLIKQNNINFQLNDLSNYQNVIIKSWKKTRNLEEIWEQFQIIQKMQEYFLEVKSNKIFKMKKYCDDYIVSSLNRKYNLSYIKKILGSKMNLYEVKMYYLNQYYNKCQNYNKIIWYSNNILWYYEDTRYYNDLYVYLDKLINYEDTWYYNDLYIYLDTLLNCEDLFYYNNLYIYLDKLINYKDLWYYRDLYACLDILINYKGTWYYRDLFTKLRKLTENLDYEELLIYFKNLKKKD
jgi:NADH-quinone oxidoreductase subunit H